LPIICNQQVKQIALNEIPRPRIAEQLTGGYIRLQNTQSRIAQ
jgi:hypothetical protein